MAVRKPFSRVEEWFDHSARSFVNHLPRAIRAWYEEEGLGRRVPLDQFPTPHWAPARKRLVERIAVRPGVRQHGHAQDALNRAAGARVLMWGIAAARDLEILLGASSDGQRAVFEAHGPRDPGRIQRVPNRDLPTRTARGRTQSVDRAPSGTHQRRWIPGCSAWTRR